MNSMFSGVFKDVAVSIKYGVHILGCLYERSFYFGSIKGLVI